MTLCEACKIRPYTHDSSPSDACISLSCDECDLNGTNKDDWMGVFNKSGGEIHDSKRSFPFDKTANDWLWVFRNHFTPYEMAVMLKEAGFSQEKRDGNLIEVESHGIGPVYSPTLSELIAACGDNFFLLVKRIDVFKKPGDWIADTQDCRDVSYRGSKTPEEAVAKLWLELNGYTGIKRIEPVIKKIGSVKNSK